MYDGTLKEKHEHDLVFIDIWSLKLMETKPRKYFFCVIATHNNASRSTVRPYVQYGTSFNAKLAKIQYVVPPYSTSTSTSYVFSAMCTGASQQTQIRATTNKSAR